jgi:hypothetical protein
LFRFSDISVFDNVSGKVTHSMALVPI